jgi:hypothetical protein
VTSQNSQTPRAKDQEVADKDSDQKRVRADADHSNTLSNNNGFPVLSLGSLPNPPAPDGPDKVTSNKGRPEINSVGGKIKSQEPQK